MPDNTLIKIHDAAPTDQQGNDLPQYIPIIDQSVPSGLDPSLALGDEGIRITEAIGPLTNFANAFQKGMISDTQSDFAELLSGAGGFEGHKKSLEVRESAEERLPTRGGVSEFLGRSIAGVAPFVPALFVPQLSIPILAIYGLRAMGQGRGAVKAHEEISGEDVSGTTEAMVAAGYGLAVFVTEKMGLANFRGVINKLAPNALKRIAQAYTTGSSKVAAKSIMTEIAKVPGAGAWKEAKQEALEQSATNVIDMSYGAKDMTDLFQGVPEAAAAGAVGGGFIGGLGIGIQAKNIKTELRRTGANRQIAKDFPNLDHDQVSEVSSLVNSIASMRGTNPKDVYNEFEETSEIVDQTKKFKKAYRKGTVNSFIKDTMPVFTRAINQESFQNLEKSMKVKDSGKWTIKEAGRLHKALNQYVEDNSVMKNYNEEDLLNYQNWLATTSAHAMETTLLEDGKPAVITFVDDMFTHSDFEPQDAINVERIQNRKNVRSMYDEFMNIFDVDNRFKEAPRLGTAIKAQFSVQDAIEGKTENTVAKVSRLLIKAGYTKEERTNLEHTLPLMAEDDTEFKKMPRKQQQRLQPAVNTVREFFDWGLQLLKEEGALEQGFYEEMRERIKSEKVKAKNSGSAEQYRRLDEKLSRIEEASFVAIPYRMWFEQLAVTNPRRATRILGLLTTKKRKTLFIRDLLERKIIKSEDVNMSEIMGYYGRRLGKDIALSRIKNAGTESGHIKDLEKGQRPDRFNGFVRPPSNAPILKGTQIKGVLADYLINASKYHDSMKLFDKGLAITKMGQFINPLFLPVYDLWQASMLGSINPLTPKRSFGNIQKAVNDFVTNNEQWVEAGINNARSTPYVNPLERYNDYIQRIAKHPNPIVRAFNGIFSQDSFRQIYNTSWKTAWALDGFIRQISYRHLTDNLGYSPADAGRLTALYHADYAGIPANTRKKMNRVFFTPTFKVAMTKLYLKMMKDSINVSIKAGENIIKGRRVGENITQEEKLMIGGLGRTIGIIMTMDILMTAFLGFDRDEWGRRYTKELETSEGVKDLVITYGAPFNMLFKYYFRYMESFANPAVMNKLQSFLQKNSWELHPVWRMVNGFMRNRRSDGSQIYDKFTGKGAEQIAAYFLSQSSSLVDEVLTTISSDAEKVEMDKLLEEELGKAGELFARWFAFAYLRDISDVKAGYQIQNLINQWNAEVKIIIDRGGDMSQKDIEVGAKRLFELIDEIGKQRKKD